MTNLEAELQKILDKQRAFFRTHKTQNVNFRKEQLLKLKDLMEKNQPVFIEALHKDLRRSPEVTVGVEMARVMTGLTHTIEHFEEWAKPIELEDAPIGKPKIVKQPVGCVLVIGAFNFPVDLSLHPAISALAAGCCVVVKPSELSSHTSQAIYDLISKNFDPAYFACVQGDVETSRTLTTLKFDRIFYTGSPRTGKLIMAAAAKNLTPVTLELGGKNPLIVLPDANIEQVAESLMFGKFLNCGQVCLMTDYVILFDEDSKLKFKDAIGKCLKATFGENPKKSPQFGRIINEMHFDRLNDLTKQTKAEVLYKSNDENDRSDLFIGPHVFSCNADDVLMQEEIFGPLVGVLLLKDLDEAIEYVNKNEKPLGLYVYTNDEKKAQRIVDETMSGGVTVNGIVLHATVPDLPFGGIGHSGIGRSNGKFGFDQFTHEKAVLIAKTSVKQ